MKFAQFACLLAIVWLMSLANLLPGDATVACGAEEQPVTTLKDAIGERLTRWFDEGTAAGNPTDWYDNRDGKHSDLRTAPWPQLRRVEYSPEEIKARRHWAAMYLVRPGGGVTFGNSSTSATAESSGSNIRTLYASRRGLESLYNQYTHSHLYIYPEHRDHDPGSDGDGGYGDLYPTNTPYLLASQGSSGSDQPFMRAMPSVLAAFRPEVKRKLMEEGLLMPTVQMLFRITGKQLTQPQQYTSGLAHPTVMEGKNVDALAMVEMAHAMALDEIPPLVRLKLEEHSPAERGVDYYDGAESELHSATPSVIAWVHRSRERARRLVVSAAQSRDVNDRPLKFTWSLLRGDPERVTLRPLDEQGTRCEIIVHWHERRPIAPGSDLESNRVDVGVFAHNGAHWSAPGFVTFFSLDHECRTYDKEGRIQEIGYGAGRPRLTVRDWPALLELAAGDSPAARLLPLAKEDRARLAGAAAEYRRRDATKVAAQAARTEADAARRQASEALKQAQQRLTEARSAAEKEQTAENLQALDAAEKQATAAADRAKQTDEANRAATAEFNAAQKELTDFTQQSPEADQPALEPLFRQALERMSLDPAFATDHAKAIRMLIEQAPAGQQAALIAARKKLAECGLVAPHEPPDAIQQNKDERKPAAAASEPLELTPLRTGDGPLADRLTEYERRQLAAWQVELIAKVLYPNLLNVSNRTPLVDRRISLPKYWRDVYHWDEQGRLLGWTRHSAAGTEEYNHDGHLVVNRDDAGRCAVGRSVAYGLDMPAGGGRRGFFSAATQIRSQATPELVYYEYAGPDDVVGKIARREALPNNQEPANEEKEK